MPGITLEQAEARLTAYMAAEEAVLAGQSYKLNAGGVEREVRKADLAAIQAGVSLWQSRVNRLSRTSGIRTAQVIPL